MAEAQPGQGDPIAERQVRVFDERRVINDLRRRQFEYYPQTFWSRQTYAVAAPTTINMFGVTLAATAVQTTNMVEAGRFSASEVFYAKEIGFAIDPRLETVDAQTVLNSAVLTLNLYEKVRIRELGRHLPDGGGLVFEGDQGGLLVADPAINRHSVNNGVQHRANVYRLKDFVRFPSNQAFQWTVDMTGAAIAAGDVGFFLWVWMRGLYGRQGN